MSQKYKILILKTNLLIYSTIFIIQIFFLYSNTKKDYIYYKFLKKLNWKSINKKIVFDYNIPIGFSVFYIISYLKFYIIIICH